MALLCCAATEAELAAALPEPLPEGNVPEMAPFPLARKGLLGCVTGVGPVNAALAMGRCLATEGIDVTAVLCVGVAGAFDLAAMPLRTLCLVTMEIWPEYGLHDGRTVTAGAFRHPLWARPEKEGGDVRDRIPLADLAALGLPEAKDAVPCTSVTVAGVSASLDRARALRESTRAALENMEGFAVAYACARRGLPCAELRTVSNKVGPRGKDEKDFPGALKALADVARLLQRR
ncbi:MAG: futalosine hydrolase [Desulfovibrio sp.]|jgi:futalosine hydrolase|nr:futalosine hydrolase [Desulfovibrio sp.]